MKIKAYLKVAIMLFAITLFFAGCSSESQKDNGTSEVKDNEKIEESSTENVTVGELTDDVYVEISAQVMYISSKYANEVEKTKTTAGQIALSEKMSKEVEEVFKKHGITQDNLNDYSEKFEKNPLQLIKLSQEIMKRAADLQKEEE